MLQLILLVVLFVGGGYAAVRGGAPERWGIGLFVMGAVLTNVTLAVAQAHYQRPVVGMMIVDVALAVAFTLLALKAQRFWPLWVAAAQIDMVAADVVIYSSETTAWAYAIALWALSIPPPVLIGLGAWRHRRRLNRFGSDPSWT